MRTNVLLWDKPVQMNRYEEYIKEMDYSQNIIIFKTEHPDQEDVFYNFNPDIVVVDITNHKEDKSKYFDFLKNKNPDIQLIGIGTKRVASDAWNYGCRDYIAKPVAKGIFQNSVINTIKELEKEKLYHRTMQNFMVKSGELLLILKYAQIIYFEKSNKKIKIICQKGEYEFYNSFEHLKKMIDMDYFIQCHQGYIVNRYKISSMSNDTIYLDESNIPIPISRRLRKDILELMQFDDRA